MKFFIITFGCKVNQYESQAIRESLDREGLSEANTAKEADVVVFNSCTVTASSDTKLRRVINRIKKENPSAILVLTGCMVQAFPIEACEIDGVSIVVGNTQKCRLASLIKEHIQTREKIILVPGFDLKYPADDLCIQTFGEHTRAFLKIEDGCNRFCNYCIIPYARGRVMSKPLDKVKLEVENLARNNYKEIVLVGINLSCYGVDIGLNLCDAVDTVCSVKGIERVRLGSLDPDEITPFAIKRLCAQEKVCPQFHLSLQSGCDSVLMRMNRNYTTAEYLNVVQGLRYSFNNAAITTDIMVGFPGETDEEFEESVKFAHKINFAKMHVFSYSRRPGTRADTFPNQVAEQVKSLRSKEMCEVEKVLRRDFLHSQCGCVEEVLFETRLGDNLFEGYTRNYTPVVMYSREELCNTIKTVTLTKLCEETNKIFLQAD